MRLLGAAAFGDRVAAEYFEYLLYEREFAFPAFYGIVKVHKREPAPRPIVNGLPQLGHDAAGTGCSSRWPVLFPIFCQTRVHWSET